MKKVITISAFFFLTVIFVGLKGYEGENQSTDSPNIIIMYSDDHTAQSIGAYQDVLNYGLKLDHTPTPNIDRLAEGGMRFDNAFVTNSICKPSRAVLLTGLHSHKNGVLTNGEEISVDLETFPKILQRNGYQTAMIGKWHLGTEPQGFDYYEVLYGQGPYYNPTMRTSNGDVDRHGHTTEIIGTRAIEWLRLQRDRDKPFMMIYNHKAPHRNWLPGPALNDYQMRDIPEPPTLFYDYSGLATPAHEQDMEIGTTMRWAWDLKVPTNPETGEPSEGWDNLVERNRLTDEQLERINNAYEKDNEYLYENYDRMSEEELLRWKYQRYIKDYLRVIREVDDEVGKMMAYLERENLLDNTIIIYAGDQGFFLGENGWFDKRWIYEESMRMPLIVHWPEGIEAGSINKQLVQNLDLAPTILELADAEIPERMQGKSIVPLLKGENPQGWRDAVYYHYYEGPPRVHEVAKHYGVRTDRYTLVHYPNHDEWELFDLESDPEQIQSVYDDPEYTDVQQRLKNRIDELQDKYEDDTWDE
ncbi:sulfatase [Halalkalibaculum sp. DA384]|uniref:sulfatase family protein n=1 Tax=Halalkalibaculum sp. DA384 TaxID=3373606 RepID=UPI0037553FC1